jgi:uncharacterized protein (DUF2249 family)
MMDNNITYVDVRELPAPEPLNMVLEVIDASQPGDVVCMIHRQNPRLLFDILNQRGLCFKVAETNEQFSIYIWHASNVSAPEIIERDIARVR